jgi:hypothetical protein
MNIPAPAAFVLGLQAAYYAPGVPARSPAATALLELMADARQALSADDHAAYLAVTNLMWRISRSMRDLFDIPVSSRP